MCLRAHFAGLWAVGRRLVMDLCNGFNASLIVYGEDVVRDSKGCRRGRDARVLCACDVRGWLNVPSSAPRRGCAGQTNSGKTYTMVRPHSLRLAPRDFAVSHVVAPDNSWDMLSPRSSDRTLLYTLR